MDKEEKNTDSSQSNSSYDDDDDMDEEENELVPYRPELENVTHQKLTLLIPPSSGPSHPRTVFFINDPNLNENLPLNNKYKTVDVEITEKKYMFLYNI